MPNGGFGCAYCLHYWNSRCNLRNANITNDHWTVCKDIAFSFAVTQSADPTKPPKNYWDQPRPSKSSIYQITSDTRGYVQVPWLEDGEVHDVNSIRTCVICQKSQTNGKGILWRDKKYFFCSNAHYLSWRNKQIVDHQLDAELTTDEMLQQFYDFRDLKIIQENTTEEERTKANAWDEERQSRAKADEIEQNPESESFFSSNIFRGAALVITIKVVEAIYRIIFN